jgi:hypothetical protein
VDGSPPRPLGILAASWVVRRDTKPARKPKRKPKPAPEKSLGEKLLELAREIPDEEWAKLPRDGAANHDHYIYGTPKQY